LRATIEALLPTPPNPHPPPSPFEFTDYMYIYFLSTDGILYHTEFPTSISIIAEVEIRGALATTILLYFLYYSSMLWRA